MILLALAGGLFGQIGTAICCAAPFALAIVIVTALVRELFRLRNKPDAIVVFDEVGMLRVHPGRPKRFRTWQRVNRISIRTRRWSRRPWQLRLVRSQMGVALTERWRTRLTPLVNRREMPLIRRRLIKLSGGRRMRGGIHCGKSGFDRSAHTR